MARMAAGRALIAAAIFRTAANNRAGLRGRLLEYVLTSIAPAIDVGDN
jgi:hypothetical protein